MSSARMPATAGAAISTAASFAESTPAAPALGAARLALVRDLTVAFRKRGQLIQPLAFFALVTMLFPLAVSPELARLLELPPSAP